MGERVLITGAGGMLGRELTDRFIKEGYEVTPTDIAQLDIKNYDACRMYLEKTEAQIVLNCAAYTLVDKAEEEPDTALEVNGFAPGILAEAVMEYGALLVHYSTDYVFDGTKDGFYTEDDTPSPLSAYGRSKLEGEKRIHESGCNSLIIRTEWLFGRLGNHFIRSIVKAAGRLQYLEVVNDQFGSPTYAFDLAEATEFLIRKNADGIVNFSNSGVTSWYTFAGLIFRELGIEKEILPITTDKLNRLAKRPRNSRLDISKYTEITGATPHTYYDAFRRYIKTGDLKEID
jgi:dTDP-4-dehydrorhamnose reductase